jgi:hypothetical protein
MKQIALVAFLSAGLAMPAMGAQHDHAERVDRLEIPTAADATLADCQVWLDQLSELIDVAEPPVPDEVLAEADEQRDAVRQACDDGRYHEGITLAADAVDMIEEAHEN